MLMATAIKPQYVKHYDFSSYASSVLGIAQEDLNAGDMVTLGENGLIKKSVNDK